MKRKIKNGIYTTGKLSFKVSNGTDNRIVQIHALDELHFLDLSKGQTTQINKESFESFLNDELNHYIWLKE